MREKNSNEHNRFRFNNSKRREADQLAIYKHDRGVELGATEKQLKLSGQTGTTRRRNHSVTLPPDPDPSSINKNRKLSSLE